MAIHMEHMLKLPVRNTGKQIHVIAAMTFLISLGPPYHVQVMKVPTRRPHHGALCWQEAIMMNPNRSPCNVALIYLRHRSHLPTDGSTVCGNGGAVKPVAFSFPCAASPVRNPLTAGEDGSWFTDPTLATWNHPSAPRRSEKPIRLGRSCMPGMCVSQAKPHPWIQNNKLQGPWTTAVSWLKRINGSESTDLYPILRTTYAILE